jgi:hypothetical protein
MFPNADRPRPLPVAAAAAWLGSTSRCRGAKSGHQKSCPESGESFQPLELHAELLSCCLALGGVAADALGIRAV